MNILIVVGDGGPAFIRAYKEAALGAGELMVVNKNSLNADMLNAADLIFVEWADSVAVEISKLIRPPKKLVIRLHSYETWAGYPKEIQWQNVSGLVFVSEYVRKLNLALYPEIAKVPNIWTIPNCVDPAEYPVADLDLNWGRVAFLGALNRNKSIPLLLHAFSAIVRSQPSYTLDIAGAIQEPDLGAYVDHMIIELGLSGSVRYAGELPHAEVPAWLARHSHIISTSVREAHPVNIVEGMMCGLVPLVHNWPGATDLYPIQCVWDSIEELVALASTDQRQSDYRLWALEHWSDQVVMPEVAKVFQTFADTTGETKGGPDAKDATDPVPEP